MDPPSSEHPPPPERIAALADLWLGYADHEFGSYSPLYASIARHIAGDGDILRLVLEAPRAAHQPNVLMAAVHYLILEGLDHPLAELYSHPRPDVDAGPLFQHLCLSRRDQILALMRTRRTQTNECGRSAPIAVGLAEAAAVIGEPLAFLDAGTSAGLNLLVDRYRIDFGPRGTLGPPDSPVRIECEVRDDSLRVPRTLPGIGARMGLDRSPVDLTDPGDARWLLACVWPDTGRLERTGAAIEMARRQPPPLRRGDMVVDLPSVLRDLGDGPVAVVTSSSYAYLSRRERAAFQEVLAAEGRTRPVAWISADSVGVVELFEAPAALPPGEASVGLLGLAVYDGGSLRADPLALMHAHGAWIDLFDAGEAA